MCSNDRYNRRPVTVRNRWIDRRGQGLLAVAVLAFFGACSPVRANDFAKPTDEELKMTSLPGYPGAPAVILFREQITRDELHSVEHYDRIKILTEDGKKYANVELPFFSTYGNYDDPGNNNMVVNITGRTIHPDGTIIPFTGKPYLKLIEKSGGQKLQEKVFTLPDVEVGSIIEYRYLLTYSDYIVEPPSWFLQDELYVKQAHFVWYPTHHDVGSSDEGVASTITWFPVLPAGVSVERRDLPGGNAASGQMGPSQVFELHAANIPPRLNEDFMPPIGNLTYSVRFGYSTARSYQEYWTSEGKRWSKRVNGFIGPNGELKDATQKILVGANTPEEKLQKLYDAVMALENTRYTRTHDMKEDKAAGMGQVNNTADVLSHGRGTPNQLTELFIGMARAAGLQAYGMLVPDRSEALFIPQWMSFEQFDDMLAIVVVDGKEQFFDPGSRYCPFGSLAWQHTYTKGLRQVEGGTAIAETGGEGYKANKTTRVANLNMDAQGEITGKIDLTFFGAPALGWRQVALRGDDEDLHKALEEELERMVPKTLHVEVGAITNAKDYAKPLGVTYKVTGSMGSATGKRVMLPSDLFVSNQSATFPHEKRETVVYFHYPQIVQDAIRVNLPSEFTVEAVPDAANYSLASDAAYGFKVTSAPQNVTTRRDFVLAGGVVPVNDYPSLRKFYSQFESKDQENIILKTVTTSSASAEKTGGQ